ncbi:MAG: hypothetical protein DWQ01_08645 [Planctomycetota bacterium]|nr:MAG: hypothetical protein DWQ01_08645 [Planctomycetota bacterium]
MQEVDILAGPKPSYDESRAGTMKPFKLRGMSPYWYFPALQNRLWQWGPLHPDKAKLFELLDYRPGKKQARLHSSLARARVLSGGARGGKSLWAEKDVLPILLTPGTQGWIVAPRYDQAKEYDYIQTDLAALKKTGQVPWRISKSTNNPKQGDMELQLSWSPDGEIPDSWVRVKSVMVEDSLLSEELDWVIVVEASRLPRRVWEEYLLMRLTTRNGVALFPSTPRGDNWFSELEEKGRSPDARRRLVVESLQVSARDNPIMGSEQEGFAREMMDEETFREQFEGIPTHRGGLVYPGFSAETHVIDMEEAGWVDAEGWPTGSWTVYRGWDFGFTNPTAILWVGIDEDGRYFVFHEHYANRMVLGQHVEALADFEQLEVTRTENGDLEEVHEQEKVEMTYTDWSPEHQAELANFGITSTKAEKDVGQGIRAVRELLVVRGDQKPGLMVDSKCIHLLKEFSRYKYPENRGREDRDPDEKPLKKNDHALDALRYVVLSTKEIVR